MISQSTVSFEIIDMAAENDPHFMYILNFNYGYTVVITQARCYLNGDLLAYETGREYTMPRNQPSLFGSSAQ